MASSAQSESGRVEKARRAAIQEALRRGTTLIVLVALVIAVVLMAGYGGVVLQRRVILGLIDLVAVVGLYVFMGNSGIMNFGSVGFMAIGAYTSALLTMAPMTKKTFLPDLPSWLAVAHLPGAAGAFVGGAFAGVVALFVGWPLMRLSGIGAGIATLSFLIICNIVLGNWNSVTGGQESLMGLPTYVGLWTAGLWAIGAIAVAYIYQETRWAIALRASREDEIAARASGVQIVQQRLLAFVLSSILSGVAGALYGHFLGTLRIDLFYLDMTFLFISMLVVGGMRSLTGAVLGTLSVALLNELFRLLEVGFSFPGTDLRIATAPGLGDVAVAAVMLLIIMFRPRGLTGGHEAEFFLSLRSSGKQ